jgi:hypothetical protein
MQVSNGTIKLIDGKTFKYDPHDNKSRDAAIDRANEYLSETKAALAERVGRPISEQEWNFQKLQPARDSRSYAEAVADDTWAPKLRTTLSQFERMLKAAEADVEVKRDPYNGMTREEARAYDLRQIVEREAKQELATQERAAHLKAVEPKLTAINQLIQNENWNPDSDLAFRLLLDKAKRQLSEPEGCRVESQRLLKQVDEYLTARQANQTAALMQQREHLESMLAKNQAALGTLADPDPAPEQEPSNEGYMDPMLD